jgi:hypothetical protein
MAVMHGTFPPGWLAKVIKARLVAGSRFSNSMMS